MNFQNVEFLISAAAPKDFPGNRLPEIAFAGKSNVGKSSVINRILQRKNMAKVGDRPGKTIHVNYFLLDKTCYLVDLPGYGFAKVSQSEKDRWGKLMEDYFAANRIHLGVLIVDYRHPPTNNDITMAKWFLDSGCPFVVVANKKDKLKKSELEPNLEVIRRDLELPDDCPVIPESIAKEAPFDMILSNPPYIMEREKLSMRPNVLNYEPSLALFVPDDDPLVFYRACARWAKALLSQGGCAIFEINESLGAQTAELMQCYGFREISVLKDDFGKDRFVSLVR